MSEKINLRKQLDINDEDIIKSMKNLGGYFDVSLNDFKLLYQEAFILAKERLLNTVQAEDLMTAKVVSVLNDASLIEAVQKISENDISGLVVVNQQNKVVGILSEKDILKVLQVKSASQYLYKLLNSSCDLVEQIKHMKVEELMSPSPITVLPEVKLKELLKIFYEKQINRLPVVNSNNNIMGIIARSDLIKALALVV